MTDHTTEIDVNPDRPSTPPDEWGIRVWPPSAWCAATNRERTHICDQPRGHDGDHSGPEIPTVTLDEGPLNPPERRTP